MSRLSTPWGRFTAHLQAWFVDHEILRILYRNFFAISPNAFRSNHPSPRFINKLHKRFDLKTIISLRRADTTGQYLLEKEACDALDIELIHVVMSSRELPHKEKIFESRDVLRNANYPILIHCKSGADRAGLMSVFYRHFVLAEPISEARKELSMKYGHFRWADTGKLDYFFDAFCAFEQSHPEVSFSDWVEHHYDRDALDAQFKAAGWANIVVNKLLKRE